MFELTSTLTYTVPVMLSVGNMISRELSNDTPSDSFGKDRGGRLGAEGYLRTGDRVSFCIDEMAIL